jgi:hypothetical protein
MLYREEDIIALASDADVCQAHRRCDLGAKGDSSAVTFAGNIMLGRCPPASGKDRRPRVPQNNLLEGPFASPAAPCLASSRPWLPSDCCFTPLSPKSKSARAHSVLVSLEEAAGQTKMAMEWRSLLLPQMLVSHSCSLYASALPCADSATGCGGIKFETVFTLMTEKPERGIFFAFMKPKTLSTWFPALAKGRRG